MGGTGRFVVQEHRARTSHFDFRLEITGVFVSWAIPKTPPVVRGDRRLAIRTADHDLSFGDFEGTISFGEYGAGRITVWDYGSYETEDDLNVGLVKGLLRFSLHGQRLKGDYLLELLRRGRWRDAVAPKEWLFTNRTPPGT